MHKLSQTLGRASWHCPVPVAGADFFFLAVVRTPSGAYALRSLDMTGEDIAKPREYDILEAAIQAGCDELRGSACLSSRNKDQLAEMAGKVYRHDGN